MDQQKHRNLSRRIFPVAFPSGQRLSAPTQAGAGSLKAVQIFLWSWSITFLPLRFQQPGGEFSTRASHEAWRAECSGGTTSPPLERGNRSSEALPSAGTSGVQATTRPRARRRQARRYRTSPTPPGNWRLHSRRPAPQPPSAHFLLLASTSPAPLPAVPLPALSPFLPQPRPAERVPRERPEGRAGEGALLHRPSREGSRRRTPEPHRGKPAPLPCPPLPSPHLPAPRTANDPSLRSRARAPSGGEGGKEEGRSRGPPPRPEGPAPRAGPGGAAPWPARMRPPHSHSNPPAKGTWGRDHPYVGRSRTALFFTKMAAGPSALYPA